MSNFSHLPHNTCQYCGASFGGESGLDTCFACWELFEEEIGPQYDPAEHPRATEYDGGSA